MRDFPSTGVTDHAIVGTTEPPTQLAADVLQHHYVSMDVRLVVRVELSGREFVQHGRTLRDDSRGSVLHLDERHLAKKIAGLKARHANDSARNPEFANHELAGVDNEQ